MQKSTHRTRSPWNSADSALTCELRDSEALPESVDGEEEHDGVEAEQDEDREVEEELGALGRQETPGHAHVRQHWSYLVNVSL